jgi:16S rRNA (cytidine1402-2'-O)-methyltransferase
MQISQSIDTISFYELNKYTKSEELTEYIAPLLEGEDVGLLSEAGMPAIADPGAVVIKMAHAYHIQVVPLTGPSSIMLALAASGLNGQHFIFHGYLPVKSQQRIHKIRQIESESRKTGATQIFMETPYRNVQMFEDILKTCHAGTLLCIAVDITSTREQIKTMPISEWKTYKPELHKRPAVFLLLS